MGRNSTSEARLPIKEIKQNRGDDEEEDENADDQSDDETDVRVR